MSDPGIERITEILTDIAEGDASWLASTAGLVNAWLARGDGVAIYRNVDFGHFEAGHRQVCSFGSERAQLESSVPPIRLPDIGGAINWRYSLEAQYKGTGRVFLYGGEHDA